MDVRIEGNNLYVDAEVAGAWGRHGDIYGFFARSSAPYGAGRLRVDVKVVTSPKHSAESVKTFPVDFAGEGNGKHVRYRLAGGKLSIQASMDAVTSNLLPRLGGHGFWEQVNIARDGPVKYWLSLYIKLYEGEPRRPGDTKEWDTQFWSGGLPELGKHR